MFPIRKSLCGVLCFGWAAAVPAAAPPVTLTNLQPVNAVADVDNGYDPTDPSALVYVEPTAYAGAPETVVRMNVDLQVQNTGADYIRLDALSARTALDLPPLVLLGDELLSLPEDLLTKQLGNSKLRRPMLTNGGFGVSGLQLEQRLQKSGSLPFGEALDVIAFETDLPQGRNRGYIFAGSHQYLVGDVPEAPGDDVPSTAQQGFVAMYDTAGNLEVNFNTRHDEVSALYDLKDGRILIAGRYQPWYPQDSPRSLVIRRLRIAEEDGDGKLVNLGAFEPDSSFGVNADWNGTEVQFHDGTQSCDVRRATMITTAKQASLYVIAAELDCGTDRRVGIAVLDKNGVPHSPFGSGGAKVYAGPSDAGLVPVGVARKQVSPRRIFQIGRTKVRARDTSGWVWLGVALGNDCGGAGSSDCEFALNAFDPDTGALESKAWFRASPLSSAQASRPHDFALDTKGRPIMAGAAFDYGTSFVAVHRFDTAGASDYSFGSAGWYISNFQGHEGDARALVPAQDGGIVLSILSREDAGAGGVVGAIGMQKITSTGSPSWSSSTFAEGRMFTHSDITAGLNYGYLYETEMASAPSAGLVEDWAGRYVLAGRAISSELMNPCEKAANELGDPMLDVGLQCGGPDSIAMARYLPFGEPDSRRWIAPSERRGVMVPEDRDLGEATSSAVQVALEFDGFDTFNVFRGAMAYENQIWSDVAGSYGSYRFPFAPSVLNHDERFLVRTHTLDHHHRNASGNRFAYDITIQRWTGSGWVSTVEAPPGGNANYLAWLRPVRAVAPGKVVSCRRSAPDTTPGAFDGQGANFVKVQHTFDPFDASKREYISYLHFAQDTVPGSICPDIDGADPDGAELPNPVELEGGELLGLVGSSGNSSSPHLHIHLTTGADDVEGPGAGSYPLLFHDVRLQSSEETPDDPSYPVSGRAIMHGSLAYPTE